ncbi:MAG: hypothetical protein AAGL68_01520 [Pseudomonadota bacterium]
MGGYVLIAIVAIVVWGVLRFNRQHNQHTQIANEDREALIEAQRERDELRKRVQVLERIVTDENTPDAKKTKQLANEIESLRRSEGTALGKNTEDMSE